LSKFIRSNKGIKALADNSYKAIEEGAYTTENNDYKLHEVISLKNAILSCIHAPIIAELKSASPSVGHILRFNKNTITQLSQHIINSGAMALSVLTQPYVFNGSIDYISAVRQNAPVPILMKDIVVSETQIDAAKQVGADCVLLIKTIFDDNLAECSLERMSEYADKKGLQVIFEVHSQNEFRDILDYNLNGRQPLFIGINNRNLNTLRTDINTTVALLRKHKKGRNIVISESGIEKPEDIQLLGRQGVDAFLIGTSIMKSADIASKMKQLYLSI
jgi:indole-3-glycerol phosphate synthase